MSSFSSPPVVSFRNLLSSPQEEGPEIDFGGQTPSRPTPEPALGRNYALESSQMHKSKQTASCAQCSLRDIHSGILPFTNTGLWTADHMRNNYSFMTLEHHHRTCPMLFHKRKTVELEPIIRMMFAQMISMESSHRLLVGFGVLHDIVLVASCAYNANQWERSQEQFFILSICDRQDLACPDLACHKQTPILLIQQIQPVVCVESRLSWI